MRQYTEGVRMSVRLQEKNEQRGGMLRGPLPDQGPSVACLVLGYDSFDTLHNAIVGFRNQSYANRQLILCVQNVEPRLRELLESLSDQRLRVFVRPRGREKFTIEGLKAICAEIRCDYLAFWESNCLHEASRLALTMAAARVSGCDVVHLGGHIEWSPEQETVSVLTNSFDLLSSCFSVEALAGAQPGADLAELGQSVRSIASLEAQNAVCCIRAPRGTHAEESHRPAKTYQQEDYEQAVRCLRQTFCLG